MKHRGIWKHSIVIGVVLILLLYLLLPTWVFGETVRFRPLERTFFDPPEGTVVTLDGNPAWGWSMELSGKQNQQALDCLRQLQYVIWRPSIRLFVGMGGWDQRIILQTEAGRESFVVFDSGLEYNGFIIHCDTAPLMELFERYDPSVSDLYLFDSGNGGHLLHDDLPVAEEAQWWNGQSEQAADARPTYRITFDGTTYTGRYRDSAYRLPTSYRTDHYVTPTGETFGIRADTGDLVCLNLQTPQFDLLQNELEPLDNPGAELRLQAEEIASRLVVPFEYDRSGPEVSMVSGIDTVLYTYRFVKQIHGQESSDYVTIVLTDRGSLVQLSVGESGWADGLQNHTDIDAVSLIADSGILLNPTVQRQVLALSPAGELVCWANVTGITKEGTGTSVGLILK